MADRYTIADGDILSPQTWDPDGVPGPEDNAHVQHACTMAAGTFSAALRVDSEQPGRVTIRGSGSRHFTAPATLSAPGCVRIEAFGTPAVTFHAGLSGGQNTDPSGALEILGGTVTVLGDVHGGDGATSAIGGCTAVSLAGGTLVVQGNLYGGNAGDDSQGPALGGAAVGISGGQLQIQGNLHGGNGSPSADGSCALSQTGGTVSITGDVTGGDGGDNSAGGCAIRATASSPASLNITGYCSGGYGGAGTPGRGIDKSNCTLAVHVLGNCYGAWAPGAWNDGGTPIFVQGTMCGQNRGAFRLTGEIANQAQEQWVYHILPEMSLDLSGLHLTNSGRVVFWQNGGSITMDANTLISNQLNAQAAAIGYGLNVPMSWATSPTVQQVQAACAAALAAYDPPTQGEMDAALGSLQTHGDQAWPTATGFALPGDAMSLDAPQRAEIAKAVLAQDVAAVQDAAAEDSLCYVILAAGQSTTNLGSGTLTVFKTDGQSVFAAKTITSQAGAEVITGVS